MKRADMDVETQMDIRIEDECILGGQSRADAYKKAYDICIEFGLSADDAKEEAHYAAYEWQAWYDGVR